MCANCFSAHSCLFAHVAQTPQLFACYISCTHAFLLFVRRPLTFSPQASLLTSAPSVELHASLPPASIAIATAAAAGRPIATVSLIGPQWSATANTADAYATAPVSLLSSQQAYRLELQLHVPDSPANHALGMVQVNAEFLSATDEVLATSSRPVRETMAAQTFLPICYSLLL